MQVLLKRSQAKRDIECAVCGQGFRLYWERTSPEERETMQAIIRGELIRHHDNRGSGNEAHPEAPFNLPEWSGEHQFSGAALLGGYSGLHRVAPASRK
ncbi:hypothetical protein [Edaphobacter flagellatus]|uniref:hypothetical protein n=1 Tax=Edaphobacter flagellatus TaxID=1933044 RepID=UPI0021B1893C|nr:hypothetical protein [Edaphobacter flagellatus]